MRLHDLLGDVDVLERVGDGRVEVRDITLDSRRVRAGSLYCCVPGSRADGHDFAAEAVAGGAVALLVERLLPLPVAQARVAAVRDALGPLAAAFWGHPSRALDVVGVTGTNGKTTVTYLLEAIATAAGRPAGRIGTTGVRLAGEPDVALLTTPEAPDTQRLLARARDRGVRFVAMEVSSHALATGRVDGIRFAAVAFTNLSPDHLDFHGSLDAYRAAKASLFRRHRSDRAAIGIDDPTGVMFARQAEREGMEVVRHGTSAAAAVRAERLEPSGGGWCFDLVLAGGPAGRVHLPRPGRYDVANALAAAAAAELVGLPAGAIRAGLQAPGTVPGRMEPVEAGQPFRVFVDYAHTPAALEAALEAARRATSGKVILVFGCGGDRDRAKRPLMGRAAGAADLVIVTSDNPRREDPAAIAAELEEGLAATGARWERILDRAEAIRSALGAAAPGDVVLVAGKGHETTQEVAGERRPFDDRQVVREALESAAWS